MGFVIKNIEVDLTLPEKYRRYGILKEIRPFRCRGGLDMQAIIRTWRVIEWYC
jgi:hypothetical protein